jgi:hypothetical protein
MSIGWFAATLSLLGPLIPTPLSFNQANPPHGQSRSLRKQNSIAEPPNGRLSPDLSLNADHTKIVPDGAIDFLLDKAIFCFTFQPVLGRIC